MKQNQLMEEPFTLKKAADFLMTGGLWLVSAILALFCIFALREILLWGLGILLTPIDPAHAYRAAGMINIIHDLGMIVLAIGALVVIMYTNHYAFSHVGQPRMVRALVRMIVIECVLVLPIAWIFWR